MRRGRRRRERPTTGPSVSAPADRDAAILTGLGWRPFFADQVAPDEAGLSPCRIASVHRAGVVGKDISGDVTLTLPAHASTGDFAVGDWVLVEPMTGAIRRRLERRTVLERDTGGRQAQLAGANIDTIFIVTSCNADFNLARLERYLAFVNQSGSAAGIVLTKPDTTDDVTAYERDSAALQRDLPVVTLNPRLPEAAAALRRWCGAGQTIALLGSSGVGKSTLVNTLVGAGAHAEQATGGIREGDAKGRHTTTARSLHPIAGGGWVIDTPGMRSIRISNMAGGIDELFAEITELAPLCKFRNCSHVHEPGCAVLAAVARGDVSAERVERWRKLTGENRGS